MSGPATAPIECAAGGEDPGFRSQAARHRQRKERRPGAVLDGHENRDQHEGGERHIYRVAGRRYDVRRERGHRGGQNAGAPIAQQTTQPERREHQGRECSAGHEPERHERASVSKKREWRGYQNGPWMRRMHEPSDPRKSGKIAV